MTCFDNDLYKLGFSRPSADSAEFYFQPDHPLAHAGIPERALHL